MAVTVTLLVAAACMPFPGTMDPGGTSIPAGSSGWTVESREHVDLWLHGYAMLHDDAATVPFFRKGYRTELGALRESRGVFSLLDVNADRLAPMLTANPELANGQFAPFYFNSWGELRAGVDALVRSGGNLSRAGDERRAVSILQRMFRTADEREWLRTFALSLDDEHDRFYREHREARQREARVAYLAADSALRATSGGALRRYAQNAALGRGTIVMALPLGGEGRTIVSGIERPVIAVPRPLRPAGAAEPVYVFVHELVGPAVGVASREFQGALPAGLTAESYTTSSLIRAGHHLLQLSAPDLADGYARYYLTLAGRAAGSNPAATLAAAFPLPQALETAVLAQVDEVWAGI